MRHVKIELMAAFIGVIVLGCGPSITETRMGFAPPRPENCDIKVINLSQGALAYSMGAGMPGIETDHQSLGSINLSGANGAEPFDEANLAAIRPHVCKMGGDEVAVMMTANGGGSSGSVVYSVLKNIAKDKKDSTAAEPSPESEPSAAP